MLDTVVVAVVPSSVTLVVVAVGIVPVILLKIISLYPEVGSENVTPEESVVVAVVVEFVPSVEKVI